MTPEQEKLARTLFEIGAVKFGAFKLKSHEKDPTAPLSPIYLDLRTPENKGGPLTQPILNMIGNEFKRLVERSRIPYAKVSGIPHAGEPLAGAFLDAIQDPLIGAIMMEKIEGPDGRRIGKVLNGADRTNDRVLLFDDLITKADSKLEAVASLEKSGFTVRDVVVVVDREQGGNRQLDAHGILLHAVFRLSELMELYVAHGMIPAEKRDEVTTYLTLQQ